MCYEYLDYIHLYLHHSAHYDPCHHDKHSVLHMIDLVLDLVKSQNIQARLVYTYNYTYVVYEAKHKLTKQNGHFIL